MITISKYGKLRGFEVSVIGYKFPTQNLGGLVLEDTYTRFERRAEDETRSETEKSEKNFISQQPY